MDFMYILNNLSSFGDIQYKWALHNIFSHSD